MGQLGMRSCVGDWVVYISKVRRCYEIQRLQDPHLWIANGVRRIVAQASLRL